MSLGFTVDALVQASRGGGALRMGLSRVPEEQWRRSSFDAAARTAAFDAYPDAVVVLPEAEAAGAEAAQLLGVSGGLAEAARSGWEDLCVVQPGADGYRLTGAAVAFPTDWRVADKIGLGITAVHAPIHGYAAQLARGVDHFLGTLPAGPIYGRGNWFVVADPDPRYLPTIPAAERFAHVSAANAGETLFVRCERQTLRRLPGTGAALFAIGVYVAPLGSLLPATVRRVAASIATVPGAEHERRAASHYAAALAGWSAGRGLWEIAA